MNNYLKKCWKQLIMVFVMLFSITANTTSNVSAIGSTVDFQRVREIHYPDAIGNWSTFYCTIDGNIAYCLNASKNTPSANKNASYVIANNEALLKVLYYGYGGPGDIFVDKMAYMGPDDAYIYTHMMASYAYSGDLYGTNTWEELLNKGYGVLQLWTQIQDLPVPSNTLKFNNEINPTFKAYIEGDLQRTEDIEFNAPTSASINLPLQDGVSLHNITKGTVNKGNVLINGGDKFYLSAPLKELEKYYSGDITGDGLLKYAPLVIEGESNYQSEGTLTFTKDTTTVSLNVDWIGLGELELTKSDEVGNLIDGAQFTLKSTTGSYEKTIVVKNGKIKVSNLIPGEYILTETKVPKGYAITQQAYQIIINSNVTTNHTVVNKLRPTGKLTINKDLEKVNQDSTTINDYNLTKVQFKITANQDIFDSVSSKKLYSKGEGVSVGSGKGSNEDCVQLINGTQLGDGLYSCDNKGVLSLSGLPMGKYDVQETSCPSGFIKDDKVKTVQFEQQDFVTMTYDSSITVNNTITKTSFTKVDISGKNEILGAHMQVIDDNGVVIDQWISGNKPHQINGLVPNKTYILREDISPLGYVRANDVQFVLNNNGEVTNVSMKDNYISVIKEDENSKILSGATLQVVSAKTKNIVDQWVSGQHLLDIDDKMLSELKNQKTVSGTIKLADGNTVEYMIKPNKGSEDYSLMTIKDNEVSYSMIDIDGNETAHMVQNLQQDGSYILKEIQAPVGYALNHEEKEFIVNEKNQVLKMTNKKTKVEIHKQDITTNKELPGAYLQVLDEQQNLIDEWVSTNEPHIIEGLEVGKTYTLNETVAPDGYQLAQSVNFKIEDTGEVQKIFMYDELIPEIIVAQTGDNTSIKFYVLGSVIAVLGVAFCWKYRKKKSS